MQKKISFSIFRIPKTLPWISLACANYQNYRSKTIIRSAIHGNIYAVLLRIPSKPVWIRTKTGFEDCDGRVVSKSSGHPAFRRRSRNVECHILRIRKMPRILWNILQALAAWPIFGKQLKKNWKLTRISRTLETTDLQIIKFCS